MLVSDECEPPRSIAYVPEQKRVISSKSRAVINFQIATSNPKGVDAVCTGELIRELPVFLKRTIFCMFVGLFKSYEITSKEEQRLHALY